MFRYFLFMYSDDDLWKSPYFCVNANAAHRSRNSHRFKKVQTKDAAGLVSRRACLFDGYYEIVQNKSDVYVFHS